MSGMVVGLNRGPVWCPIKLATLVGTKVSERLDAYSLNAWSTFYFCLVHLLKWLSDL